MSPWQSNPEKRVEMLKNGVSILFRGFSSYFCTNLRGLCIDASKFVPLVEGCRKVFCVKICDNRMIDLW